MEIGGPKLPGQSKAASTLSGPFVAAIVKASCRDSMPSSLIESCKTISLPTEALLASLNALTPSISSHLTAGHGVVMNLTASG